MEEKDAESRRRWQLDDSFEALEKDERAEDERSSADSARGEYCLQTREARVTEKERKLEKMMKNDRLF